MLYFSSGEKPKANPFPTEIQMAVEIEARGKVSSVYPANGKQFTINELVNFLGPNISIYELEGQSRQDRERAFYVVTTGLTGKSGVRKNETATSIYAPHMKGLADSAVYGDALICTFDELGSGDVEDLRTEWHYPAPRQSAKNSWRVSSSG